MAWTTPTVEIAFVSAPVASAPTWVDVTDYVIGDIAIKQGRVAELDKPSVGTLAVTLNNRDRRFDPSHASGPYFGNLRQRKRIRVRIGSDVLFTGWVRGWPQTLDLMSGNATVQLQAVDSLGMLALSSLGQTPYIATQSVYAPDLYLRCDDEDLSLLIDSSGEDNHAVVTGALTQEPKVDEPPLPVGQTSAIAFDGGLTGGSFAYVIPPLYNGATLKRYQALSVWVRIAWLNDVPPVFAGGPLFGPRGFVMVSDSRPGSAFGKGQLIGFHGGTQLVYTDISGTILTWAPDLGDSLWHHLFVVVDRTANSARFYFDGSLFGTQATTGGRGLFETHYVATQYSMSQPGDRRYNQAPYPPGNASNLAFMQSDDATLWNDAAGALYAAAKGWQGDTEAQRVGRVLDAAGWPSALRTAGYSGSLQPIESELPSDALAYLLSLTRQDGSTVLGMRDGSVKFRNRYALLTEARSINVQAAFDDAGGATYRYVDLKPALDDEYVYNVITGKLRGGERTYTVRDAASVETYFARNLNLGEVRAVDDAEVVGFLGYLLRTYSTPRDRLRSITLNARTSQAIWDACIDLWLGDRITVSHTPLGVGSANSYDQWIESVEHHINVTELTWQATYGTSPARVTITEPFLLDGSAPSELDDTATLGP
jgi:hypothetical protein